MQCPELLPEYKVISKHFGVENSILYDTQKIPITEDFKTIYTLKHAPAMEKQVYLEVKSGKILVNYKIFTFFIFYCTAYYYM